jgi:hypothetical protein
MKYIFIPLLFIFFNGKAQCDSAMMGEFIGLGNDTNISMNPSGTMTIWSSEDFSKLKRHVVRSTQDSIHFYQHANTFYSSKVTWDFEANRDTVKFITPPSILIIGTTRYKSIFLNGTWYILIDPKQ